MVKRPTRIEEQKDWKKREERVTELFIRFGLVLCVLFLYLLLPSFITMLFDNGDHGEMIATGSRLFMILFCLLLIMITSQNTFRIHLLKGQGRAWLYALWPLVGQIVVYIFVFLFHGSYSPVSLFQVIEIMIIAIAEEFIFRIFIIQMLLHVLEVRYAVFYSVFLFSLAHSINLITTDMSVGFVFIQMILACFIGEFFAYGYAVSFNILPFIITHFVVNLISESFIFTSTPICIVITALEAVWMGCGATVMLCLQQRKINKKGVAIC